MTRKKKPEPNGTLVSRPELCAKIDAMRWEMRAWIVGALILSKVGGSFVELLKNVPQDAKDAAACIGRACGFS
jgi:hypothetical protein